MNQNLSKESQRFRLHVHEAIAPVQRHAVLFLHGYKGFANWGCWDLMCDQWAKLGFPAFRMDFSGNGTTPDHPSTIIDLEAWSENNYSKEVREAVAAVRDIRIRTQRPVVLVGHSRGGGIAVCAAAALASTADEIAGLVTLAAVADFERRFPDENRLKEWAEIDALPVRNGRTGETYQHRYQFYLDFLRHADLLNVQTAARGLRLPALVVHASDDPAVPEAEAHTLFDALNASGEAQLRLLPAGGHVFGAREPWLSEELPKEMAEITKDISHFIHQL